MGLFSKVTDVVGKALNGLTGVNSQMDKSYQQQIKAMNQQNAYNTQMWNLQNEYNTPSAQLARMREAGIDINPTSYALGTGNLSNTAALVNSESGFAGSGTPAGNPISALMGVAGGIASIMESRERAQNLKEMRTNIMEQGNILFNQMEGSRISNEIARQNLHYARAHDKPVGWSPSITSTPVHYSAEVLSDSIKGMMK